MTPLHPQISQLLPDLLPSAYLAPVNIGKTDTGSSLQDVEFGRHAGERGAGWSMGGGVHLGVGQRIGGLKIAQCWGVGEDRRNTTSWLGPAAGLSQHQGCTGATEVQLDQSCQT